MALKVYDRPKKIIVKDSINQSRIFKVA